MAEPLMIYDSECALCDGTIDFILNRERKERIRFVSNTSEAGRKLIEAHGLPADIAAVSVVFIDDGAAALRSDAAIGIAKYLRSPWSMIRFLKLLPRPVRDWGYHRVANNRYRLFGRLDACRVVAPAERWRFPETLSDIGAAA